MMNTSSLLVLSAIAPYLTYILVGIFAVPMLIAMIVGAKKGFRKIGWGGLIWGCIGGGYVALDLLFRKSNPIVNIAFVSKLSEGTKQFVSTATFALAACLAVLVFFGLVGLIFRPRERDVKKEYHYYAKSSPYAQVAKGGKYVMDSPYDEETEEDYEETAPKKRKGKIQTVKGGKPCFFNRFIGAIVAAVNAAVVVAVLLGLALVVLNATALKDGILKPVYENKTIATVFPYVLKYELDILFIGIIALYVRRGYKVGIASGIRSLLVPILKFGAIVGGLYLPFSPLAAEGKVLSFIGAGSNFVGEFLGKYIPATVAASVTAIVGKLVFGIILVLVMLLIVFIIGWLLDRVIDGAEKNGFVAFLDGSIATVLYLLIGALVCVLLAAILYLVEYLGFFASSKLFTAESPLMNGAFNVCEEFLKPYLQKFIK